MLILVQATNAASGALEEPSTSTVRHQDMPYDNLISFSHRASYSRNKNTTSMPGGIAF